MTIFHCDSCRCTLDVPSYLRTAEETYRCYGCGPAPRAVMVATSVMSLAGEAMIEFHRLAEEGSPQELGYIVAEITDGLTAAMVDNVHRAARQWLVTEIREGLAKALGEPADTPWAYGERPAGESPDDALVRLYCKERDFLIGDDAYTDPDQVIESLAREIAAHRF